MLASAEAARTGRVSLYGYANETLNSGVVVGDGAGVRDGVVQVMRALRFVCRVQGRFRAFLDLS